MEVTVWNEGTTRKGCIDSMKLSARNTLKGTITAIHPGAVNAIVIMELEGGQLITSTISMGSLKELELEVGKEAYAIVKASSVIIGVDDSRSASSVRTAGAPSFEGAPAFLHLAGRLAGGAMPREGRRAPPCP